MHVIDPSARIETGAVIGQGASIGPFCAVGRNVVLGEGCRLLAHVHLTGHTTIGAGTVIYPFASLGTPPQSVKYRGGETRLVVGADCDIREGVTVNTGTEDGGGVTVVGDRCFLMAGSHVGHDCQVGSDVTFANNAVLGGHVTIGDRTVLGGQTAVHQFVRVGEGAMLGGVSGVAADVIPFGFALGQRAVLVGLNMVGLKRSGLSRAELHQLRQGFRALFLGPGKFRDRLETVAATYAAVPLIGKILDFVRESGSRPIMMPPQVRGGDRPEAPAVHE
jgi:UDP-N-acetylglucosamine acyltransferase